MPTFGLYGMTESAGAATTQYLYNVKLYSAGEAIPGVDLKIDNPDKDGNGEICMKGRNIFMGYFKNEKANLESFDKDGYLHSGDIGVIKDGHLDITGRIKELIITAGGENIAPVLIEHLFKEECPIVSNIMIVGDDRKFLSAIIR
jgi:long-chain-fatty-acid--CoA ligase ACSBG